MGSELEAPERRSVHAVKFRSRYPVGRWSIEDDVFLRGLWRRFHRASHIQLECVESEP